MVVKTPKTKIITKIIKLHHYSMKKKIQETYKINFQVPYGLYKLCHLSKTHGDFTFPHSYKPSRFVQVPSLLQFFNLHVYQAFSNGGAYATCNTSESQKQRKEKDFGQFGTMWHFDSFT